MTPGGTFSAVIGPAGDGAGGALDGPGHLALGPGGNVYVAGELSDNVFEITPGGVITEIIDATGDGLGGQLDRPFEIAVDASGTVYVAGNASDNAFSISTGGLVEEIIDATGDGAHPLSAASGIAVDGAGRVFVAGSGSDNVFRIDPDGSVTQVIDATGDGANPMHAPVALLLGLGDRILVAAVQSDNAFELSSAGAVTQIVGPAGDGRGNPLEAPRALEATPAGWVYVSGRHNVFSIAPSGAITEVIDPKFRNDHRYDLAPTCLALDGAGDLYICAEEFDVVLLYDPTQCEDGFDNDADGLVEVFADPGCRSRNADDEAPACNDGVDDDGDGDVDLADAGCAHSWGATEAPACDDGVDNDLDGGVDWDGGGVGPADLDCAPHPHSNSEKAVPPDGEFAWEATLSVDLPAIRPMITTAVGVSQLFRDAPEAAANLDLSQLNRLEETIVMPVTDPEVTQTLASFRLAVGDHFGRVLAPATGPGALAQVTLPVPGVLRICLVLAGRSQALRLELTKNQSKGVGIGGMVAAAGSGPIRFSALGYPFTIGSATLTSQPTGPPIPITDSGFAHHATSATTTQLPTNGELRLIAPVQISTKGIGGYPRQGAMFASLTLRFVPEPDVLFLLVSGCAGLALMGWRRRH